MNKKKTTIKYFDLYGLRGDKYKFLENHNVKNTDWQEIEPKEPYFWFVPKEEKGEQKYNRFISLKNIFMRYNAGIATGKDDVLVEFNKDTLKRKLTVHDKEVFELNLSQYNLDDKIIKAWEKELDKIDLNTEIKAFDYRPFDIRYTIYNNKILQRARQDIMNNLLKDNIGISTYKNSKQKYINEIFVINNITDKHLIGAQTFVFPLYLYGLSKKSNQESLLEKKKNAEKEPNIRTEIFHTLKEIYKKELSPEEIFYYIYTVLYSNIYRQKYNEFLRIDFPKIPFTANYKIFQKLARIGKDLTDLHLMKSAVLNKPIVKFNGSDSNKVEKRDYIEKEGKLFINSNQYFDGIKPEVYNYHVGGYQVLVKWLKDRIGRTLSLEEIKHYCKIVTALSETINVQKEIDKLYPEIEKELIKWQ